MANLRRGFRVDGQPMSAEQLDNLTDLEPDKVEGASHVVETIAERARIVVQAGLEGQLDITDLSLFEIDALALARKNERQREIALTAVAVAAAIRTPNLASLVPDDLAPDVPKKKFVADFERRAWESLWGKFDV